MDIKAKDAYRVQFTQGIEQSAIQVLMTFYQPLVYASGILVYLTLIAEAKNLHTLESHSRLLTLTNLESDVFDRACAKLEEYMLLRVYMKEGENRNTYIYVVQPPLQAIDFVSSKVYMNRYTKAVGQKQAELSVSGILSGNIDVDHYRDITRKIKHMPDERMDYDIDFVTVKPRNDLFVNDDTIGFDFEKFISTTSSLVFPVELRTQENLYLIGKLATIHGLSVERMRILVSKCCNLEDGEFDKDKLIVLAGKCEPDDIKVKDPYDLSPVSFLQSKQGGASVAFMDRKILEKLGMEMHFSNPVINVLIEHILKINDNRLNPQFVYKVAAEWARDGVRNKEEALAETQKESKTKVKVNKKDIGMPEYLRNQKKGIYQETNKAKSETIERIKKKQNNE